MTKSPVQSMLSIALLLLSAARHSMQQNSSNSTDGDCSSFGFTAEPVNATGEVSFSGLTPPGVASNSWILSESLSDRRDNQTKSTNQFSTYYLSTPVIQNFSDPHTGIQGCIYMLGAVNKTSSSGDSDWQKSCDGVVSSPCQNAIASAASGVAVGKQGQGFVDNSVCTQLFGLGSCSGDAGLGGTVTAGFNFSSSDTCDINREPTGIDIPDDYRSDAIFGAGASPSDQIGSYAVYDSKLKQTSVFAIAAWGIADGSTYADSRLVCIRPSNITAGSRTGAATRIGDFGSSTIQIGFSALLGSALFLW